MCVWGGGCTFFSNTACIANGLIFEAYTLHRYSDKNHKFLFSGTSVKYVDHEERACIVL